MRKSYSFVSLLFLSFLLSSCAQLQTRKDLRDSSQESVSEPAPQEQEVDSGPGGVSRPKLGVILGPGSVKAFAHTGVIKELEKANIPIHHIVGIEWGALVAGLYAQSGKINEVEWKLYKLQAKNFAEKSLFSDAIVEKTVKVFHPFLVSNLEGINIDQTVVPFACPSLSIWSGVVVWQHRGALTKAVEKCLPYPPLFKPKSPWMAAAFAVPEAVEYLRKKGAHVILFVNVLGSGQLLEPKELMAEYTSAMLWQELRRSLERVKEKDVLVINVITTKNKIYDFSSRNALVMAGEKAGQLAADQLVERFGF